MAKSSVLLVCLFLLISPLIAAPVEFGGTVDGAIGTVPGELNVLLADGRSQSIWVTEFTEIKDEDGFPGSTDLLVDGAEIEIEALFTDGRFVALEIEIQGVESEFELRVPVVLGDLANEGDGVGTLTVLEGLIEVDITPDTNIRDDMRVKISLDAFEALLDPVEPILVGISGEIVAGSSFVAHSIKVLSKSPNISIEGIVGEVVEGQITVDIGGGVIVPVNTENAEYPNGEPVPGDLVHVKGYLDNGGMIVALRVRVKKLFEVTPRRLCLEVGDAPVEVMILLEWALESDLEFTVESSDPAVAEVTGSPVFIAEGDLSGSFMVTAGTEGTASISIIPVGLEGQAQEVHVSVGEPCGQQKELEIKWTPRVIHAAPKEVREVRLMLKHGVAPEGGLEIPIELVDVLNGLDVQFDSPVEIPEGQRDVRVLLTFLSMTGSGKLRASLPEELGGSTDDLRISMVPSKLQVRWVPNKLKLEPEEAAEARVVLNRPAPIDLSLPILKVDGADVVTIDATAELSAGEFEADVDVVAGIESGKAVYRVAVPNDLGGDRADLRIEVKTKPGNSQ